MGQELDLDGSTAVITGASSGIGEAIARRFAAEGASVSICSRSYENVENVAADIAREWGGDRALAAECDVREAESVKQFVEETVDKFGTVDILVNNAAGTFRAPFKELSENAWKTIFDINVHGSFLCAREVGRHMRDDGGGTIINLSSVAALSASPQTSHYGASKAAVVNMTESLAVEWAEYDIRVNCIAPGLIATPPVIDRLEIQGELPERDRVDRTIQTPTGERQIGNPEEIADIAFFLATPASSYITGETIVARGVPPTR